MSTCLSRGYSLAGVEFGQCTLRPHFCVILTSENLKRKSAIAVSRTFRQYLPRNLNTSPNSANQVVTSSNPSTGQSTALSDCSMACSGDSSQTCGGGNRIQIYTYTAPLPSGWSNVGCYTDDTSDRYEFLHYPGLISRNLKNGAGLCRVIVRPQVTTHLPHAQQHVLRKAIVLLVLNMASHYLILLWWYPFPLPYCLPQARNATVLIPSQPAHPPASPLHPLNVLWPALATNTRHVELAIASRFISFHHRQRHQLPLPQRPLQLPPRVPRPALNQLNQPGPISGVTRIAILAHYLDTLLLGHLIHLPAASLCASQKAFHWPA
jgi:hypothetical protein